MEEGKAARALAPRYLGAAIGVAALIVTSLFLIPFSPSMPSEGLDPSWQYALNEAVAQGRVFGRDLIFTFGPLGLVYTGNFNPATDTIMMIASAVYALGFCAAIALLAHPRRYAYAVFLPIATCLSISMLLLKDPVFLVLPFALLLAITRVSLSPGSPFWLRPSPVVVMGIALSTCAVAIEPIIKGSFTGVVMPVCGLAFLLLLIRSWRAGLGFVALALCALVAAWVGIGQPVEALPNFFVAQSPVISGYAYAMAVEGPLSATLVYLAVALILSTVFYLQFTRATGWRGWVGLLGLVWVLFVAFKSGFVRQDGHMLIAAGVLLLMGYAVSLLSSPRTMLPVLAAGVAGWVYITGLIFPIDAPFVMRHVTGRWDATAAGIATRLFDPGRLDRDFAAANARIRAGIPLPPVTGTVDVYPWDLSIIFANGLHWSGRPVFQSYSVYEPSLDATNLAHLRGSGAPDTVFLTFLPIDDRPAAMDDSSSLLQLLAAYEVVGYRAPYVELAKHAPGAPLPLNEAAARVLAGTLGADIAVDAAGPVWARLNLHPTFLGRVLAAAYKLPPLRIVLKLDDGRTVDRRYIPGIGNTGFILSPYLEEPQDFLSLAAGLEGPSKVASFRITTTGNGLWSSSFDVKLTPIRLTPQPTARTLLMLPPTPAAALSQPITSPKAQCYLDFVNGGPPAPNGVIHASHGRIRLQGWTNPPASAANGPDETWVSATAVGNGERRFFRAESWPRPDVVAFFRRPGMKNPGFTATFERSTLNGPQTINIYSLADGKAYDCGLGLSLE
jgi:hypothetical protein